MSDLKVDLEGQGWSSPKKINQLSAIPPPTYLPSLEIIQTKVLKNKGFRRSWCLTLFWPWPLTLTLIILHGEWYASRTKVHVKSSDFDKNWGNKMFMKNQFFHHDVINWEHNDEMFIYLKSTYLELQFEILLDIVCQRFKNELQLG